MQILFIKLLLFDILILVIHQNIRKDYKNFLMRKDSKLLIIRGYVVYYIYVEIN